jgi:hypothetical protein
LSGWRFRCGGAIATATLALTACGGGAEQNTNEHHRQFPVQVSSSFPTSQRLAQQSDLVIYVRNAGSATIPNVAVTITNPRYGTAAQAFGILLPPTGQGQPILASRSRPVWIIDRAPGRCGYSCRQGGAGAAVTAYSNTWALGRLRPGHTARFDWHVTAIKPGRYVVRYRVAAGLNGVAKAVSRTGHPASGSFVVRISSAPRRAYVKANGTVVYSP